MMPYSIDAKMDAKELVHHVTMNVTLYHAREQEMRVTIATWLIKLAGIISGFTIKIHDVEIDFPKKGKG